MNVVDVIEDVSKADNYMAEQAMEAMQFSQSQLSGVTIGASVKARNKDGDIKIFKGTNIEISPGCQANIHAERLALLKAISEGYIDILECFITSNKDTHMAAMCGYCMQDFTYFNKDCRIVVIRQDYTTKIDTTVVERQGKYGYFSKGKVK